MNPTKKKLLYIEASPRKARAHSIDLATGFLDSYQSKNPDVLVDKLDLWAEELPSFDGDIIDAKYELLSGGKPAEGQREAWATVEAVIERFSSADLYVISTPMWNFGIPYKLKHLIDVIAQPSYTFDADFNKPFEEWGLLTNKKAVIISARGGAYDTSNPPLSDWDFQGRYLDSVLRYMGIKEIQQVAIELTAGDLEGLPARKQEAQKHLEQIAQKF